MPGGERRRREGGGGGRGRGERPRKTHHLVPLHFFLKVTEKNRLEGSLGSSWYTNSGGLEFGMVAMSRFKDRIRYVLLAGENVSVMGLKSTSL